MGGIEEQDGILTTSHVIIFLILILQLRIN